jgi:putative protein-disulfide isomerase
MGTPVTVTYLFDPLCGWCYGASPGIQALSQHPDVRLILAPSGLFAGGGRVLDAAFAGYAWSNDQRIGQLTGQRFSEAYRHQVLGREGRPFDSTALGLALSAVALTAPEREVDTLRALQEARYVQGLDTSDATVVEALLRAWGLVSAAELLASGAPQLLEAHGSRVQAARQWMNRLGVSGVPALVLHGAGEPRLVSGQALYGGLEPLLRLLLPT